MCEGRRYQQEEIWKVSKMQVLARSTSALGTSKPLQGIKSPQAVLNPGFTLLHGCHFTLTMLGTCAKLRQSTKLSRSRY